MNHTGLSTNPIVTDGETRCGCYLLKVIEPTDLDGTLDTKVGVGYHSSLGTFSKSPESVKP